MGHSTNILSLRVNLTFKWQTFFVSSHYFNYYFDYTFFYILVRNYLYYICRFKYYYIWPDVNIFFNSIKISLSILNSPKISVYLYDLFFLRFFKKFIKLFSSSLSLKKIKNLRFISNKRKKRRKFLKKFKKNKFNKFKRPFDFLFDKFTKAKNIYGNYNNKLFKINISTNYFKKKNILNKFNNDLNVIQSFFTNGLFYKKIHFFRLKRFSKKIKFLKFLLKLYKFKFFIKKYSKKNFYLNFEKYKNYFALSRNRTFFIRKKKRLEFFFFFFKLNFNLFFFKKIFIYKNNKIFLNFKFFFFIFYVLYLKKLKKRLRNKKFKRLKIGKIFYKKNKVNKLNLLFLFGMFFNIFNESLNKKKKFKKLIKYFTERLLKWFWFFFCIKIFKKLYIKLYKKLKIFFFIKLKKFLFKLNYKNVPLIFKNFNIFPNSFLSIHGAFVLLYFRWKLYRKFTLNQTVWPFIRRMQIFNKIFIKGMFFKGSGRFTRKQRSDLKKYFFGQIQFNTYLSKVSYNYLSIITKYGKCGLKLWFSFNKQYFYRSFNSIYKINLL